MILRWQISAGEITEWLPPLLYAFAVLASAWTLHDARRRFPLYAVLALTLATLIHTPVVLPLYLIARTFKPRAASNDETPDATDTEETEAAGTVDERAPVAVETDTVAVETDATAVETDATAAVETGASVVVAGSEAIPAGDGEEASTQLPPARTPVRLKRYALPLIYASALLSAGAIYFYRDYHSFDAHLARATNARLLNRRDAAIREYRAALRISDDAHTHKLLALQLSDDGQREAALAELRAAERGGETDELLTLRLASTLDALGRAAEAASEYRKFLQGSACARPSPHERCAEAAARLAQAEGGAHAR